MSFAESILDIRRSIRNSLLYCTLLRQMRGTRTSLFILIYVIGFSGVAAAQTPDQQRCTASDPAVSIPGCTAVIQSGHETPSNLAVSFYNRGNAYAAKSEVDRAIQDFDQAIRLNPNYAAAYRNRGSTYNRKGQPDRAIQDFDQAIRLEPNNANAFYNRANAYGSKAQYDRAIQDFDQAIRLNPKFALAYHNRGLAKRAKGDISGGDADIASADQLNPGVADASTPASGPTLELQTAALRGDAAAVQLQLAKGADINAKMTDHGVTALMGAAQNGHVKVVQLLLAKGADINAKSNEGGTALIMASQIGNLEAVQALLAKGADIEARSNEGGTALILASQNGHPKVVQALLAKGADVNAKDNRGLSALMIASYKGQAEIVQALLAKGAEVNARRNDGRTAMEAATAGGHADISALLARAGADKSAAEAGSGAQVAAGQAAETRKPAGAGRSSVQAVGWIEGTTLEHDTYDSKSDKPKTSASSTYYVLRTSDGHDYLLLFVDRSAVGAGINVGRANTYTVAGELAGIPPNLSDDMRLIVSRPDSETGRVEARDISHVILVKSLAPREGGNSSLPSADAQAAPAQEHGPGRVACDAKWPDQHRPDSEYQEYIQNCLQKK